MPTYGKVKQILVKWFEMLMENKKSFKETHHTLATSKKNFCLISMIYCFFHTW